MNHKGSILSFLAARICCLQLLLHCHGQQLPIKAVNLGGWLVTEGWITPDLFDGIPNGDLLDGTQVQLKSVTTGKYLCAEDGGGTIIVANRTSASSWETFKLWRVDENDFNLKVFDNQFWGLGDNNIDLMAEASLPSVNSNTFQIVRSPLDGNRIRIKAPNGNFLQAWTQDLVTADYSGDDGWGDDNPSVFILNAFGQLHGEFQVSNGWGPEKAPEVMQNHWDTFIVEDDFQFMSQNGLTAVRIPVGWWIASDPTPPAPFVGGSLNALDNAFNWAEKYGMKVIIDLHAAPGSQNGNEHSGTRDGSLDWGKTDDIIQLTLGVIDFLTQRYANRNGLLAVELINEPVAPGVTYDSLCNYYQEGYSTVRKYTNSAYVIMSARLGPADSKEFYPMIMDNGMANIVLDVHYYNLFTNTFTSMTVQQNIDYVYNNRAGDLSYITGQNGPLVFIGEWVVEWDVEGATMEDYQRFAQAQLNVYGNATFGWSYWTLKCRSLHWDMQEMIQQGYIALN